MHNLVFCAHTLWLNYVADKFLLVNFCGTNLRLLCFVHGEGQKSEQKNRTKNFAKLHNHLLFSIVMLFIESRQKSKVSKYSFVLYWHSLSLTDGFVYYCR